MDQLGLHIPGVPETDFAAVVERAEEHGWDSVWITAGIHNISDSSEEDIPIVSHDPFLQLHAAAMLTDSIELCIGVLPIYGQSAVVAAQSLASLDVRSDGRAVLGVGTGHPKIIERAHGKSIENPVEELQTFSETIQRLTTPDLSARDRTLPKHVQARMDFPLTSEKIPVYVAALGPRNVRAIGAYADGWVPNMFPRRMLVHAIETIKSTSEEHGRDRDAVTISPQLIVYVDDGSGEAEVELRKNISSYIVYQPFYANLVARTGFEDAVETARDQWDGDNLEEVGATLPAELVENIGAAGTPEEIRETFDEYRAIGADQLVIYPRNSEAEQVERVITEIP